jgi:Flp pilus assembly protein TadD
LTLPPAGSVARDEALLVQSLCTLAEGCDRARFGNTTAAERLLRRARGFARDDPEVAAPVESNLASVCNRAGRFAEAEEHAREAVLLARKPHAYANWATAVAYQDDLDRALEIAEEGRSYHPDSLVLESTFKSLAATATGREAVPQPARGMRYHRAEQRAAAALSGKGVLFGGQWDFVSFRGKLTNPVMDPSSQDLGTAMRRANIATVHISTTNIEETG